MTPDEWLKVFLFQLLLCLSCFGLPATKVNVDTSIISETLANILERFNTEPQTFNEHKVWRVTLIDESVIKILEDLEELGVIDLWRKGYLGGLADFRVHPELEQFVLDLLKKHSDDAHPILVIQNVQDIIDQQLVETLKVSSSQSKQVFFSNDDESFFQSFHEFKEIQKYYDELTERYPHIVSPFSIGKTYEGREISGIHIRGNHSTTKGTKEIIFHGGVHAREWIGPAVVTYLATKLIQGYNNDDTITHILNHFDISIIPVLNIDGYIYSHEKNRMWRKNRQPNKFFCVGTDPNRNWDFKWGTGGASSNPCSEAYQGPKAFSTPEALNLAKYFKSRRGKIVSYIDFHSYSQLWMFPYGALCNKKAPDFEKLDQVAKAAVKALKSVHGTSFAAGPICDIIYQASGSSVDWTYAKANVTYSMAVELRDKGQYGFLLPPNQIIPSGQETFAAFIEMLKQIENLE